MTETILSAVNILFKRRFHRRTYPVCVWRKSLGVFREKQNDLGTKEIASGTFACARRERPRPPPHRPPGQQDHRFQHNAEQNRETPFENSLYFCLCFGVSSSLAETPPVSIFTTVGYGDLTFGSWFPRLRGRTVPTRHPQTGWTP